MRTDFSEMLSWTTFPEESLNGLGFPELLNSIAMNIPVMRNTAKMSAYILYLPILLNILSTFTDCSTGHADLFTKLVLKQTRFK